VLAFSVVGLTPESTNPITPLGVFRATIRSVSPVPSPVDGPTRLTMLAEPIRVADGV